MWTHSQHKALLLLSAILLLVLAVLLFRRPVMLDDPPGDRNSRSQEIMDRLDPNSADAAALAAIPNIGEKRAAEIVDYRQAFLLQHPHELAFNTIYDMRRLKGFGPATEANLSSFLVFPGEHSAQSATGKSAN